MLKSNYDNRQFKYLNLDNGMRIVLIEDVNCQKSACAITVNSGHFNDDQDCNGLSHLLEHMLFMGNEKYPKPNQTLDLLSSVGGHINAQTGTEYTSYFLDSSLEIENQTVDHLYQMLATPLFDEKLIEKEVQAIDAEFSLKQKDELRRLYQVHKETCNPEHPFSKFSVGNKQTFSPFSTTELKAKLQKLHHRYYQPQNICMCWISATTLTDKETICRQTFSHWQNQTPRVPLKPLPPLYLAENLATQINIKPLQQAQRLIVTFALANPKLSFRSKPLSILSHLLGDEGDNSLLDYLKQNLLATSLSAGGGIEGENFKDFNINIQLTDTGINNIEQIIKAIFAYISIIRNKGIASWRIEELAAINQQMWDFSEPAKPIDEALHISQSMFDYPEKYTLAGDYLLDEIKPELSVELLSYFTPQNMRIKLVHPKVSTTNIAKWYETPYKVKVIDQQTITNFLNGEPNFDFRLPKENEFLIKAPSTNPIDQSYDTPKAIVNQQGLKIWFGQDSKFSLPKGDCFLTFDCPAVNQGIELVMAKRLWVALLNEKLNKRYYQAELAGMHFHFYPHQGGFSLQTNGFSDNQLTFCSKLLTQIVMHDDFTQSFAETKKRQLSGLSNALLNKPINRLFSRLAVLMQQHSYLPTDMANSMQLMTPESVYQAKQALLGAFYLEGLMYGNWTAKQASEVTTTIKTFRDTHPIGEKVTRGVADIRAQGLITHNVECQHPDPAVVIYFQAPKADIRNTALTILTEQLVAAPFFNEMRTEKQLGYLVGSGYIPYNQHPGLAFYIQSPHTSVSELILAIHQFLQQLTQQIDKYVQIWESIKKGVIRQLSEKDANLSMKSQRFWMGIGNKDYDFSHTSQMLQTVAELDVEALKCFLQQLVDRNGFGEMILYSGELDSAGSENSIAIDNPNQFKNTHLYM